MSDVNCNVNTWVNTDQTRLERPPLVKATLKVQCSYPVFALVLGWRQRFFTQKYFLSTTSLACSSALNFLFCSARSSLYGEKKETLPSSPPAFFIRTPLVVASVFLVKLLLHKRELTTQKMKLFIKDFFSNCDQIHSFLRMWSNLLKKSLMENFFLCSDYIKALEFVKITYTLFFEKLFLSHIHKRN